MGLVISITSQSLTASTLALRFSPVSSDISPKQSPSLQRGHARGVVVPSSTLTLASPLTSTNIDAPSAPSRMIVSPRP